MDDLQRPPADGDREQVVARINRAHDDGRISTPDRDIRLGNARSAQSLAELDLMSRDLGRARCFVLDDRERHAAADGPGDLSRRGARPARVAALFVVGYRVSRNSDECSSTSPGAPAPATWPQRSTAS